MRVDRPTHWSAWRRTALAGIVAAGITGIVGCGGVGGDCGFCTESLLWAFVSGPAVVQVGDTVNFTADASSRYMTPPVVYRYHWCRSAAAGTPCNDIPGATGNWLTLDGANRADDGAVFTVVVEAGGKVATAQTTLHVSNTPPVSFEGGEFQLSDWSVTSTTASSFPPTHQEERVPTDGHPGAYLRTTSEVVVGGMGPMWVQYLSARAEYDPATQGALYALEMTMDTRWLGGDQVSGVSQVMLLVEQGGRRFVKIAGDWATPAEAAAGWRSGVASGRLESQSFQEIPGCVSVADCAPDFSAAGAPMRFGFGHYLNVAYAISMSSGVDNWKLTVWRR